MLKSLQLANFTVFPSAKMNFGKNLNVIVGENGSGKSHLLKAAYSALAVVASQQYRRNGATPRGKPQLERDIANKLLAVLRPDGLGRLVRRQRGRNKCSVTCALGAPDQVLKFKFSTLAKTEVTLECFPSQPQEKVPVFLPTRELLTIAPGFVSLYETTHLSFEETWRNTCILLQSPLARGPRAAQIKGLLAPLEAAMGGTVELDEAGRFYLNQESGRMEMHLVAEGLRKLAMLARLIATGSLLDKGCLFWDEPESNLNPKIIKTVARTILQLAVGGIQIFIATHSLFLMRELHILKLREFQWLDSRCFGLHVGSKGAVEVLEGKSMDDIGSIAALDEDLQQSERYIDTEMDVTSGLSQRSGDGATSG